MRALVLVIVALAGCRDRAPPPPPPDPPPIETGPPPASVAEAAAPAEDPWTVRADPDDPPDVAERKRLSDEACPSVTGPYFYRIEKAGKVSHILGSRHIGVPLTKFPPIVKDQLARAKVAAFETAPDDDGGDTEREISLPDALGPALWARYRSLVGARVARSLERGTPSAALLVMTALHEDLDAQLDTEIEHEVLAANIPVHGLESSASQHVLIRRHLNLRMLRAAITHTEDRAELAKEARDDLAEYCAGTDDTPGLDDDERADLLASGYTTAELDRMNEEMLDLRNARWIPRLEQLLAGGDAFITVGADHLRGQRGVIELLAARGYKVTRVRP